MKNNFHTVAPQYGLVIIIYIIRVMEFLRKLSLLNKEVIIMNIFGIAVLILAVWVVYYLITHTGGGHHTENTGHKSV